jgi:choline dehydrogenase-like flavoprotein
VNTAWFTKYQRQVEDLFSLTDSPYEISGDAEFHGEGELDFLPRLAKWPAFTRRNVSSLLKTEIDADSGPIVWLGASVVDFVLPPSGTVESVLAMNQAKRTLSVSVNEVVLAAGAIESTRLLLMLDRRHDQRLFGVHHVLGRYFHDHLSACCASITVRDVRALNRIVGFRFEGQTMRNLRFEPSAAVRNALRLPNAFLHISFTTSTPTGFDALRGVLRHRQAKTRPSIEEFKLLIASTPWLTRALWWRFVESRLLFPPTCSLHLHTVVEQEPVARNRIGLSEDRQDVFGSPLATIDWRVSDLDVRNALGLAHRFEQYWTGSALRSLGTLIATSEADIESDMHAGGGVFHPGGTTRMGRSAREGVVDEDLRCFALPNLSVLSTSVFPTGGGSNPTMMLLMAAFRMGERLSDRALKPR